MPRIIDFIFQLGVDVDPVTTKLLPDIKATNDTPEVLPKSVVE
jgi:hypothetical protein